MVAAYTYIDIYISIHGGPCGSYRAISMLAKYFLTSSQYISTTERMKSMSVPPTGRNVLDVNRVCEHIESAAGDFF